MKFQNVVVSQDVYNTTENVNYMTNACFKRVKTIKNFDVTFWRTFLDTLHTDNMIIGLFTTSKYVLIYCCIGLDSYYFKSYLFVVSSRKRDENQVNSLLVATDFRILEIWCIQYATNSYLFNTHIVYDLHTKKMSST